MQRAARLSPRQRLRLRLLSLSLARGVVLYCWLSWLGWVGGCVDALPLARSCWLVCDAMLWYGRYNRIQQQPSRSHARTLWWLWWCWFWCWRSDHQGLGPPISQPTSASASASQQSAKICKTHSQRQRPARQTYHVRSRQLPRQS
ncbi:uncharacterized protein K452DRAFT_167766 [Aplosporella prunicola CBS 121167]|uniref:Uncharacterized protein n=1 Tax=Aplosporella prunicola CBS 121167 TaxID=1176127 RepID=A0A6A6BGG0_9PEZI|nr:uncharacterized protein K452DRAFT_167766 [Aplosporella prunicola CBS 121167]KAF2143229.1 hypothetical protein K452DRAFT_167766 [Aplosporella prunicola CBS 121167]